MTLNAIPELYLGHHCAHKFLSLSCLHYFVKIEPACCVFCLVTNSIISSLHSTNYCIRLQSPSLLMNMPPPNQKNADINWLGARTLACLAISRRMERKTTNVGFSLRHFSWTCLHPMRKMQIDADVNTGTLARSKDFCLAISRRMGTKDNQCRLQSPRLLMNMPPPNEKE